MNELYYDDVELEAALAERAPSLFLAGPTVRRTRRTPWRREALGRLAALGFSGTVVIPEFRDRPFEEAAAEVFASPPGQAPGMRTESFNILRWETCGIERSTAVLFWMPFALGRRDDPISMPGFTTRAEVSRELARDPSRIVLGMPRRVVSGSQIR